MLSTVFLKRFIAQRVFTAYTWTNYKIVPLTSLNKYLHYGITEPEISTYIYIYIYIYIYMCVCVCVCVCVQITAVKNNEQKKNTSTTGKLVIAVYVPYFYVCISCTC